MPGTAEICGCDLLNASNRADVNAARAIAFETNLIQNQGYEFLDEVDRILNPMIPVQPGNPGEGEDPREYIEYRMGLSNTNIAAGGSPFASGSESRDVTIDTPNGPQNLTVTQKSGGSLACDNRSVTLVAGSDVRTGIWKTLPDVESPCICTADFDRAYKFAEFLKQFRGVMPQEMALLKERQLLRDMVATAKYNVAESGADEPLFTEGYFAHAPVGGANIATFRKLRDRHRRQGHKGNIRVPISGPSLQSMMISWYQLAGIQHQVMNWISGAFPQSWQDKGTWVFEEIEFVLLTTPILGIFKQVTTASYEFFPLSTRVWRAGTQSGAVYDYNEDYDKPFVTVDGQRYDVYEMIPVVSPQAYFQQPYTMVGLNVEGVNTDAMMWNGTNVRVIGGAFIDCNEKLNKFKFQLSHAYKLVPKKPYLASFVAIRKGDYLRTLNEIGLIISNATAAAQTFDINGGSQPDASSCADQRAGLYPMDPAPGPQTDICDDVGNSAGNFRTPCIVTVDENASSITVYVERINGTEGAASIAYATVAGTGADGTDYTATSGTLSWPDGTYGPKPITVAIPATARHGRNFTIAFSGATGASLIEFGCTSATITIDREANTYALASNITGDLTVVTIEGSAAALPNFPYDDTQAGAEGLQDDLNDLLAGDGTASVSYSARWNIAITSTRRIFTSATAASGTSVFTAS